MKKNKKPELMEPMSDKRQLELALLQIEGLERSHAKLWRHSQKQAKAVGKLLHAIKLIIEASKYKEIR